MKNFILKLIETVFIVVFAAGMVHLLAWYTGASADEIVGWAALCIAASAAVSTN